MEGLDQLRLLSREGKITLSGRISPKAEARINAFEEEIEKKLATRLEIVKILGIALRSAFHNESKEEAKTEKTVAYQEIIATRKVVIKAVRNIEKLKISASKRHIEPNTGAMDIDFMIDEVCEFAEVFNNNFGENETIAENAQYIIKQIAYRSPKELNAIFKKYEEFSDTPGILRRVIRGNPLDPADALESIKTTIKRLSDDKEFFSFRKYPGIIRHVAVFSPSNPDNALRKISTEVSSLQANPAFLKYSHRRGFLLDVTVHYPTDPTSILAKIDKAITDLEEDDEFKEFADTPKIFERVVLHNPTAPKKALRKAQKIVDRLVKDPQFEEFKDRKSFLQRLAIRNPVDPERTLMRIIHIRNLLRDSTEFAKFRNRPSLLLTIALDYPTNPQLALKNILAIAERLASSTELPPQLNKPWLLREIAIHNRSEPEAALERAKAAIKLLEDAEFEDLKARPSFAVRVVLNHAGDIRIILKNFMAAIKQLSQDREFSRYSKAKLYAAVLEYPTRAESALRDGLV